MVTFEGKDYKYAHVFMVDDVECKACATIKPHFLALISTTKNMSKTVRVKRCIDCNVISAAPIEVTN